MYARVVIHHLFFIPLAYTSMLKAKCQSQCFTILSAGRTTSSHHLLMSLFLDHRRSYLPVFVRNGGTQQLRCFVPRDILFTLYKYTLIRCCQFQGSDEAAARLVDGILRRKSFYFQQRSGKLDMRAIGRVDIDSVVKDVDIDTLQVHHRYPQTANFVSSVG